MLKFLKQQAFGIAILASAMAAYLWPNAFIEWGDVKLMTLVGPIIQLIMFGMGTTLSGQDFLRVAKNPVGVALGVVLQFAIMPIVGLGLAKLCGFTGELAAGMVLIGSVAGGTASNVICYLAHANVALSVTMTCCSTLLSPLLTPLAMKVLAGQFVEIDALAMMVDILKIVLVPVAAGLTVHTLCRKLFERHQVACNRVLSCISMSGICATILFISAVAHSALREAGVLIIVAAVAHNVFGYVSGYWLTRLVGRWCRLSATDARTVAVEVGMQNGGMAAALATGVMHSAVAALPANIFSIWMNFSGSLLANFWSKHPPKVNLKSKDIEL